MFNQYNFNKILDDIAEERVRQDAKFGITRNLTSTEWLPALVEEIGEFAQCICDNSDYNSEIRVELIQIAALAVAIIQDLDAQCDELESW